jgi:3-deoxy-D-manno-octulosonic-acid transferase
MTTPPETPSKLRFAERAGGRLVAGIISATYRTSTPPPLWDEHVDKFHALHPFILALWHGQFMLLPAVPRDHLPTRAMIALHSDAELLADALRRHDLELIRGAGAGIRGKNRGGAQAFRGAVSALQQGYTVAMTADVPPGPARICGPGIITLARISGRPILPVALASSRYISLKTWSRMTINLPGSRLGGSIGEVIRVPADATDEDLEIYRRQVERQLDIATADAYGRAGANPDRSTPLHALDADGAAARPGFRLKSYRALTRLAKPVVPIILRARAKKGKEEPARRGERYGQAGVPRPAGHLAWIHAASVGETNAILPLIDALKRSRPKLNILLTTFTVTSARLAAARLPNGVIHQYVPFDAPEYVAAFLDHWKPDLGVFTESEIWPNLVLTAANRDVPLALINARMSKPSFRKWRGRPGMALPVFSRFQAVLAQNKSFELFYRQLGARGVQAIGNLKVDAPPPPVDSGLKARLEREIAGRPVWLAASTHDDEEVQVARAHQKMATELPNLLTLIAPRHPLRGAEIAAAIARTGLRVRRRDAGESITAETDIYVVDTVGELGTLFALAPVTFMGKSLIEAGGGQNPIEPIRHASAVITGPRWENFADQIVALKQASAIVEVKSAEELAVAALRLLTHSDDLARQRLNAAKTLEKMSGALPKTVEVLLKMLPDEVTRHARV